MRSTKCPSSSICLCIDHPWSLVKGLFGACIGSADFFSNVMSPPLLPSIFIPSHHRSVQSLCYFSSSLRYHIGPFQRSNKNLPFIKHPFNSPSFTPSVLPSIPWLFGHPSVVRGSFPCYLHPHIFGKPLAAHTCMFVALGAHCGLRDVAIPMGMVQ